MATKTQQKTNFLNDCKSMEEAKKLFHSLLKKYHPDLNPDGEEICKMLINEYRSFSLSSFNRQAEDFFKSDKWTSKDPVDLTPFTDILEKILMFDCDIEIIGFWIYCFNAYNCKDQLKELGFFYSGKHKAWIYSGTAKKRFCTKNTTDDNRATWGAVNVEKSKQAKLTA
ncbi:MAG: hypothetical protein CVV49_00650 [Spirochaetae bacterium HGW-Spirochaetae-5]|nr:MAG: hypothetical protein CVV49_00650 [Spirochaetae bacterium HGW-Spirochaetae-5]